MLLTDRNDLGPVLLSKVLKRFQVGESEVSKVFCIFKIIIVINAFQREL